MQVAEGADLALSFPPEQDALGRWGSTSDAGAVLGILAGPGAPAELAVSRLVTANAVFFALHVIKAVPRLVRHRV